MRRFWRILDVLFMAIAILLLIALVQGMVQGGWLRRIQYKSLAENAWRERIYTVTWAGDALEFQYDRTDYLILEDCGCDGMGRSRWDLYLTNGRLRGPHARDGRRHLAISVAARSPDPSQHFVTLWTPHWLLILVLSAPLLLRFRRRPKSSDCTPAVRD